MYLYPLTYGVATIEVNGKKKKKKKQGAKSADDYNVTFMAKHLLSGFSDKASLEIWKKGLKPSILQRIYNEAVEPANFAAWRAHASHYDRIDCELSA